MLQSRTKIHYLVCLAAALFIQAGLAQNSDPAKVLSHRHPLSAVVDEAAFQRTFAHGTATVNGISIHYVAGGSGTPLVLLHGWPQTWYEWKQIMLPLSERFTVVAVDLRGGGDSDKPVSGYDKKTMAQDIYGLAVQLGYSHFNLAGHDIGGMVAYALAATHPEAVDRLAILDVPLPGIGPWTDIKRSPRAWHFAFHGRRDVPEYLVAGRERGYLEAFYDEMAYNPEAITEEQLNRYTRDYSAPGALRGGFEWYRAFPQDELDNAKFSATKLAMPVLALGGEAGTGTVVMEELKLLATNVQGGTIPRAGHWLTEEQPDVLLNYLLGFFSPR